MWMKIKWEIQLQIWSIRLLARLYYVYQFLHVCWGFCGENVNDAILGQRNLGNVLRAVLKPYRMLNRDVIDSLFDILIGRNCITMVVHDLIILDAPLELRDEGVMKDKFRINSRTVNF